MKRSFNVPLLLLVSIAIVSAASATASTPSRRLLRGEVASEDRELWEENSMFDSQDTSLDDNDKDFEGASLLTMEEVEDLDLDDFDEDELRELAESRALPTATTSGGSINVCPKKCKFPKNFKKCAALGCTSPKPRPSSRPSRRVCRRRCGRVGKFPVIFKKCVRRCLNN